MNTKVYTLLPVKNKSIFVNKVIFLKLIFIQENDKQSKNIIK